jgi:hypothetical protein
VFTILTVSSINNGVCSLISSGKFKDFKRGAHKNASPIPNAVVLRPAVILIIIICINFKNDQLYPIQYPTSPWYVLSFLVVKNNAMNMIKSIAVYTPIIIQNSLEHGSIFTSESNCSLPLSK